MIRKTRLHTTIFYCLALLFFTSCALSPAANTDPREQNTTEDTLADSVSDTSTTTRPAPTTVTDIQKKFASVMKELEAGRLDSSSFKYSCNDEKRGSVTYFSHSGQLRMIVHRYNEYDHYSAVDQYFVENDRMYFAHLNGVSWFFEDGGGTRDNVEEQRIYVVNQLPIRCLEKKYTIRSKASDNPRPENVANKEVDCKSPASIIGPYQILLKYREKGTSGCLIE